MTNNPLPPVTAFPVLIKSDRNRSLDGAGVLFPPDKTEYTGLHVVSRKEAAIHLKRGSEAEHVCTALMSLRRKMKERDWPGFREELKQVWKWTPHIFESEIDSIRDGKEAGFAYSSLMSNLLHKATFIIWYATKGEDSMRPGLYCPNWEVAAYAVVGMDGIRKCAKPGCAELFLPKNPQQSHCTQAHANADRVARCKARKKSSR